METIAIAFGMVACYVGGVISAKYLIADLGGVKQHLSDELNGAERRIRADFEDTLKKIASKL